MRRRGPFLITKEIMAAIKGQNLRILVGTSTQNLKCIASAKQCIMHVVAVVGEADSKDSENVWAEREVLGHRWNLSAEALITTDTTGATGLSDLAVGQSYKVRMSQTTGASGQHNRDAVTNRMQVTGDAILTELQMVASNHQLSVWKANFVGNGELSQSNN